MFYSRSENKMLKKVSQGQEHCAVVDNENPKIFWIEGCSHRTLRRRAGWNERSSWPGPRPRPPWYIRRRSAPSSGGGQPCCAAAALASSAGFRPAWTHQLGLKVHKHEIIVNFFLPKSNPYMPFVNFRKKFRFFFSFDFRQNLEVRTFPRWLSIRGTKFFWRDIQKFFSKMFTWVLLDVFLNGFSKFRFFIVEICILIWDFWVIFENYSMRMLSIRGNDFIAHWAYEETISSHTEHTPNEFKRMLNQRKNVKSFYMYSYAEHTGKWFYRTLSIRGNDFIAPWAYEEMILSHPEHTRKCLKVEYLGRIEYDFQKISCYRPLGP